MQWLFIISFCKYEIFEAQNNEVACPVTYYDDIGGQQNPDLYSIGKFEESPISSGTD